MTTLVVLQPSYLPWLGYFDQIRRCDHFVFYDDVQFDKHGWRNRNRIKTAKGPAWLTVPVMHRGRMGQSLHEVEVAGSRNWARKHILSMEQAYARAPHTKRYLPALSDMLERDWSRLNNLNIALTRLLCAWFGLERPMHLASGMDVPGDRNTRLLALCQRLGADRYLSGVAAQSYLDVELFQSHGIAVDWQTFEHPQYPQQHGSFIPYLSAIDLLFNLGDESLRALGWDEDLRTRSGST